MARTAGRRSTSSAKRPNGWIDAARGEAYVPLTRGNLVENNSHIYLRSVIEFFPPDSIGGSKKAEVAAQLLQISFDGGAIVETDIAGQSRVGKPSSNHRFFRMARRAILQPFFTSNAAKPGDTVRIKRLAPNRFDVTFVR